MWIGEETLQGWRSWTDGPREEVTHHPMFAGLGWAYEEDNTTPYIGLRSCLFGLPRSFQIVEVSSPNKQQVLETSFRACKSHQIPMVHRKLERGGKWASVSF
jgi:hypothetical protein